MKILLEGIYDYQVYVQKRDLLYLERTQRFAFPYLQAIPLQGKTLETTRKEEFVQFKGYDAFRYFQSQTDILDYLAYLELSEKDLEEMIEKASFQEHLDPYFLDAYLELSLEKGEIQFLSYPFFEEKCRPLKTITTKTGTYTFYSSAIPKLFFFQKEDKTPFFSSKELPLSFVSTCRQIAETWTFADLFIEGFNKKKDALFLLPLLCENEAKKEQEDLVKNTRFFVKQKKLMSKKGSSL